MSAQEHAYASAVAAASFTSAWRKLTALPTSHFGRQPSQNCQPELRAMDQNDRMQILFVSNLVYL